MSRRLALALLVAGVATLAPAAAAATPKPTPPSITLRPSRAEGVLSGRVRVGPFSLINGTQASYQVRLFPILLGQARDASLFVREDARSLRQARSLMRPELGRFRFPPGASTSTALRVRRVPRQHSLYSGLVFEAVPRKTGAGSPQLNKVFRLTATVLLDPPRPQRHIRFVPEAMRAEQAGPRKLRIAIGVKNRGNYYTPASGIFRIRDAAGRIVVRQGLRGVRILPGAVVDLDSIVTKLLPAGAYTLEGSLRAAGRRIPIAGSMRLLGPSTVAFRDATLSTPPTPKAYLGEPFDLKARFLNTGNVTFAPHAVVDVRRVTGSPGRPLRINAAADRVKPGQHGSVSAKVRLPGPGTYELTVRLLYGGRELDSASVGVTPVKKPPLPTRILNSIKNDPITWLLVLAAIALLVVGSLLVYVASLRRRQAQPAAPVPAPPAAPLPAVTAVEPLTPPPPPARVPVPVPSSNGPVNLNSATVDELMTLPGIGRKAAGRIVAHREAIGPYTDISELLDLEGFHAERISRLRGSVRV